MARILAPSRWLQDMQPRPLPPWRLPCQPMRLVTLAVLAAVPGMLLAGGKDGGGGAGDGDGGGTGVEVDAPAPTAIDAAGLDAGSCATPAGCDWIEPYQRDIVGRLAG